MTETPSVSLPREAIRDLVELASKEHRDRHPTCDLVQCPQGRIIANVNEYLRPKKGC